MDEVFGEANFLAQVVVNLNPKGRQLGRGFATSHEYVLVVRPATCRPAWWTRASTEAVDECDFPLTDARRAPVPLPAAAQHQQEVQPGHRADAALPAVRRPGHRSGVGPAVRRRAARSTPVFGDGRPAVWRWSRPRIDERPDDLVCRVIRGAAASGSTSSSATGCTATGGRRKKLRTIWLAEEIGSTDTAVAELKEVVGHVFESPKPTGLVRRILSTHARRRRRARPLRRQRHHRSRRRARQRRRRRHPPLHQHQLRRAHPRGLQRPARRPRHGRRHHPRPPQRRRRARRRRARGRTASHRMSGDPRVRRRRRPSPGRPARRRGG